VTENVSDTVLRSLPSGDCIAYGDGAQAALVLAATRGYDDAWDYAERRLAAAVKNDWYGALWHWAHVVRSFRKSAAELDLKATHGVR